MNKNIEIAIEALGRANGVCREQYGDMKIVSVGTAPRRLLPFLAIDINLRVAMEALKEEII